MSILDQYEHVALLGEGYFSKVSSYRHKNTSQLVAVKKLKSLDETHVSRIGREVKILGQLSGHPHIVELIGHEFSAETYLYLMPAAKSNLEKFISRNNQNLTLIERISLFDHILEAIQFAHSYGIIHRDINPNNVLIFETENEVTAKVCDFGLGKHLEGDSGPSMSSVANYGQLYYVAPEQQLKLKDADQRSDVYSLGRLLNFVLTGRRPDNSYGTLFDRLIQKATLHDPEQRYQTIEELLDHYERIKSVFLPPAQVEEQESWEDPDGQINWEKFHQFAATRFDGDSDDYIVKILDVLRNKTNLNSYIQSKRDQLLDFVDTLNDSIKRLPFNGYDFEILDPCGEILYAIFTSVSNPQIKLEAFDGLMKLASDLDQWDVQNLIVRILRAPIEYQGIEDQIASTLLSYKWKPHENLDNAPDIIKRACAVPKLN